MEKAKEQSRKRAIIKQKIAKVQNIVRHFLKEILIALALAALAAVAIEVYKSEVHKNNIGLNQKATATVLVYDKDGNRLGQGSGVFINSTGLLVTNFHVVGMQGSDIGKTLARLHSGAFYRLKGIRGLNNKSDIALLQFDAVETPHVKGLGNSDNLLSGQSIVAIGSPLNQENSVSEGVIANPARRLHGLKYIQFTAPISPGSSGGGLFDKGGKVVGITSASLNDKSMAAQNLNLAIPINLIKETFNGTDKRLTEESPAYYYSLGQLEEIKRNWNNAIEFYQRCLSIDDQYTDAYIGLGGAYWEKGEYTLEVSNYEKAVSINPKNHEYHYLLATAYEDIEQYSKAKKEYSTALLLKPDDKDTLHDFSILLIADGDCSPVDALISKLSELDVGLSKKLYALKKVACR